MTTDTNHSQDESPFAHLIELRDQAAEISEQMYVEAVRLHDKEKHSWRAIGEALGRTRQAAWERWGKRANQERAADGFTGW